MNKFGLALIVLCVAAAPIPKPDYVGFLAVMKAVPQDVYPKDEKGWTELKREAANKALDKAVNDKSGEFTIIVDKVGKRKSDDGRGNLLVVGFPVKVGQINVWPFFFFQDDMADELAKINSGDHVVVTGTILNADFLDREGHTPLQIEMKNCKFRKK